MIMRGKIIMINDRKISDDEREEAVDKLKKDAKRTVINYPDGHVKSLSFNGGLQVRSK
jgi:hypothetical protein